MFSCGAYPLPNCYTKAVFAGFGTPFGSQEGKNLLPPKRQPIDLLLCSGSPTWTRTRDLRINSPSLYRLSYQGIVKGEF